MPTNWSRRFKNHVEKLKSGDIYQVAEVVRNLTIREKDKGLSAGEKRMLGKARQILVSELTFALNVDEETAEARLDEVLGKGEAPEASAVVHAEPVAKAELAAKPAIAKVVKAPAAKKARVVKASKAPAAKAAKPVKPPKAAKAAKATARAK